MNDEKYYRYCFFCDKWLTKQEINEVDLGQQPGNEEPSKGYYCQYCRKDLGAEPLIIRCQYHPGIILKVWGTSEGENKEKIFFEKYPREEQEQGITTKKILWWVGSAVAAISLIALLIWVVKYFFTKEKTSDKG